MIPQISVETSPGGYVLQATSYGRTEPAGPRLFRGGDIPDIKFSHADIVSAKSDAIKLQKYVDQVFGGRKMSKATIRKHAAD